MEEHESVMDIFKKKFANIKKTNEEIEKCKEFALKKEQEKQESMTIKEWFIEKFKSGKNSVEAICEFHKLNEKTLIKIIKNTRKNKNKNYDIPAEIKKKFENFWNIERKELEKKYINSKIQMPINKNKPVIFLNPGFGFEDEGASVGKDTTRDLNAIICEKILNVIKNKDYEIYLAFNLKYAGIDIKKHKNVHILFDKRPPILGDSGEAKMYEASSSCMRAVAEKILKHKNSKFFSLCLHHDYSDNKKDVGFKVYYQADKYTSKIFRKNSKNLSMKLCKNCKDIYKVSENEGNEIRNHIIEENWAMANLGEMALKKEFENSNAGAVVIYFGYISNKAQLEKLKQECLQEKTAKAVSTSLCNFLYDLE